MMMLGRLLKIWLARGAGALLLGFLAVAGATLANAQVGGGGVIHACVDQAGAPTIVAANVGCPSGTNRLDWNAQGRPGVSGLEIVAAMSSSDSSDTKYVSAPCPFGSYALSGGYNLGGNISGVRIITSAPSSAGNGPPTGWFVSAVEDSGNPNDWQLKAYAVCANVTP